MSEEWTLNTMMGEMYGPAMQITDPQEAAAYFERIIQFMVTTHEQSREEAEHIQRSNLGYYAGYYDNETRERVERLFCCSHPIFGSIAERGALSPEEAFEIGMKMGRKAEAE